VEKVNMLESGEETPTDVTAQVRRHLESLRAAGVEWLPAFGPLMIPTEAPAAPVAAAKERFQEKTEAAVLPVASPVEDRRQELDVLAKVVSGCTRCKELTATRTQTVFGVGRIDPDICFIGEAPGREEDATGEPFVGPAGQLLTRIIAAMGMKREEVYICNILRCRPPSNRQPQPEEAANCREYLERTLELVRPKYICALGATAAKYLLGTSQGITKMRGNFYDFRGTPVMCTFHPSYLLRDPTKKKEVWDDMRALLTRLGKPIPQR
jgi:uracil-DNA glycosylase family 4